MSDPQPQTQHDPFDTLLSLEDQYYNEGHALGSADGSRAGRIEGRVFGLEKGFEKFAAMGVLAGRCAVWEARLATPSSTNAPSSPSTPSQSSTEALGSASGIGSASKAKAETETESSAADGNANATADASASVKLKPLAANARLAKHLQTLYALTEAESLSTQNDEDSVADFDDRFKRAEGKVKVIEKVIGEASVLDLEQLSGSTGDAGGTGERRRVRVKRENVTGGESSMEDFNIRGARS